MVIPVEALVEGAAGVDETDCGAEVDADADAEADVDLDMELGQNGSTEMSPTRLLLLG